MALTARPCVTVFLTHSQESSPGQSSEPGTGLQSVRGHQQRETLRHLRLQRLQRLLQTQREEEAHLQARGRSNSEFCHYTTSDKINNVLHPTETSQCMSCIMGGQHPFQHFIQNILTDIK